MDLYSKRSTFEFVSKICPGETQTIFILGNYSPGVFYSSFGKGKLALKRFAERVPDRGRDLIERIQKQCACYLLFEKRNKSKIQSPVSGYELSPVNGYKVFNV